jgi:hypothetical protein
MAIQGEILEMVPGKGRREYLEKVRSFFRGKTQSLKREEEGRLLLGLFSHRAVDMKIALAIRSPPPPHTHTLFIPTELKNLPDPALLSNTQTLSKQSLLCPR